MHSANGKFFDWSVQPIVIPKPDMEYPKNLPKNDFEPKKQIVFDYSNIKEIMPKNYYTLTSNIHEYLSYSNHIIFHQFDLKHAY